MLTHPSQSEERAILFRLFALSLLAFVVELGAALASESRSLLADAFHVLMDQSAIAITALVAFLARRAGLKKKRTIELAGGRLISASIFVLAAWFGLEAVERFKNPPQISGWIFLLGSAFGLFINLAQLSAASRCKCIRCLPLFRHLQSDFLLSVPITAGALFHLLFSLSWVDPVLTLVAAVFILHIALDTWRGVHEHSH